MPWEIAFTEDELPTPAFSGPPPTESRKCLKSTDLSKKSTTYVPRALGSCRLVWAVYGCSMLAYCSRLSSALSILHFVTSSHNFNVITFFRRYRAFREFASIDMLDNDS